MRNTVWEQCSYVIIILFSFKDLRYGNKENHFNLINIYFILNELQNVIQICTIHYEVNLLLLNV